MGEVAAACVAGALSLEDAVRVICHRSRLFKRTIGQGAMAAVELSIEEARRVLAGYEDRVSIAASNGPTSTVLSGDPAALAAILDRLQRRDIFCRMVKVDFASHSPQMEPLRADLLQALEGLGPRPVSLPIYSTVTGKVSHGPEFDALYWARNMREPVLFSTAVQRLLEDGHDIFLEISPHPILLSAMQQGIHHLGQEGAVLPSLRREEDERTVMLGSLGALYSSGIPGRLEPDLSDRRPVRSTPVLPVATGALLAGACGRGHRLTIGASRSERDGNHPLLGRHFKSPHPAETHFWETTLDKKSLPYLDDHRIQGVAVLPASAYVEMALAAAVEAFGAQSVALKDIEFRKALFLPEGETRTASGDPLSGRGWSGSFSHLQLPGGRGQSGKSWMLHATARSVCRRRRRLPGSGQETLAEIRTRCAEKISGQDYYSRLRESGIHYGPFFQSIAQLWRNNGEVLGEVRVPDGPEADFNAYQFHPAILDACLQVFGAAVAVEATETGEQEIYLPTRIDQFRVHGRPGPHLWGHAQLQHREPMPSRERYGYSMKRDTWRSRFRDSASNTWATRARMRLTKISTTGFMSSSGSPRNSAGMQRQDESVAQASRRPAGKLADLCRQRWRRRSAVAACWKPRAKRASWSLADNPTSERTASIIASVPNGRRTSAGSSRRL